MKSLHQLLFILLASSSLSLLLHPIFKPKPKSYPSLQKQNHNLRFPHTHPHPPLKVYVANIPASFNYGLLSHFYSYPSHANRFSSFFHRLFKTYNLWATVPSYPENPLIKPHAAEYWLLNDLQINNKNLDQGSTAVRVPNFYEADVVFVPFFASLSAQMELAWGQQGRFREKNADKNGDYRRQREVLDRIKASVPWRRSGGRDHVFVMSDPVAMWHMRSEIAPAILLVGDLGEQVIGSLPRSYLFHRSSLAIFAPESEDTCNSTYIVHDQASLVKDVIVPCNHLLPRLHLSHNHPRHTLLYFNKGPHHAYTDGSISKKLWKLLENEPGVKMEEGSLNAPGLGELKQGMRDSEFCLHPAGDMPTSCSLFDAVASLCIPVIVSDQIELPFEGMLDYTDFAVFVSVKNALTPKWMVEHLRGFSEEHKERFLANLAGVQSYFEYGDCSGSSGGAVNLIWDMIYQKLPMIKQALAAERRKIDDRDQKHVTCLCT